RERSSYKLVHTVGLDQDQVDYFARQVGPHVKASASAIGRSESQVDRISSQEWNALRAQLRVRGRTVGMMSVGTMVDRLFSAADLGRSAAETAELQSRCDTVRPRLPGRYEENTSALQSRLNLISCRVTQSSKCRPRI